MKLIVIGSSSKGNCYLLQSSTGETLIVEAGVKMQLVKQALSWQLNNVVGCVCTHRHNDHSKYIGDMMNSGIRTLALADVFESHNLAQHHFAKTIESMHGYIIGTFKVFVLSVCHDVPCVGFIISHDEMGKLLFLTDTMMFEYKFPKSINHVMIEANYADEILQENIDNGIMPVAMRERLLNSHMELRTTAEILRVNDTTDVVNVILLHLSDRNSDADMFQHFIEKSARKTTYVARSGLEVELSQNPY